MLEFLFNKIASLQSCNFIKKKLHHRCFKVKSEKFSRRLILKNICKRLLLTMLSEYGWDHIAQEICWCNDGPDHISKQPPEVFCKSICERLVLLIVIFLQENNHIQRCLDLPEPNLHKKLTCVMLIDSPQTTFHRKILSNFFFIYQDRRGRSEVFCKKGVLRNIAKLTGKHLCQSLFFNKVT